MALTSVDKVKINKYLKEHALDEISFIDMCDFLGKRGKISEVEFLEHFTNLAIHEFNKESKISIKNVTKIIAAVGSFVEWTKESELEVQPEVIDKIRNLKHFYSDYLEKNNLEANQEFLEETIEPLISRINELYPSTTSNESMSKYINRISELENQLKTLKKELEDTTKLKNKYQDSTKQKNDKIDSLTQTIEMYENSSKEKETEITKLNDTIEDLTAKITDLDESLDTVQKEKVALEPYQEKCQQLTEEVTRINEILNTNIKEKTNLEKQKEKETKIESLIYQKLLLEKSDLDSVLNYVQSQGLVTNKEEVSILLKRIRNKINIDCNSFSTSPNYKIATPKVNEHKWFTVNIPATSSYYDIMLVSDFHIRDINTKILSDFDVLNDYCTKNGIHLILNLGDFFEGTPGKQLDYNLAMNNYKLVEKSIAKLPKAEGLYHAVLGGNHDRSINRYGFDPIDLLSKERDDFINLGYKHCTVALNDNGNKIGCFDIHHPNSFDFPIDLDSCGIDIEEVDKYLSGIYEKQGRTRESSYIDILGHTHKSQFNYPGSYCYIPSFINEKNKRGACHLRVYLNDDRNIKYMVFMPLSYQNSLVKNNEIIYQKVLTKKN